MTIETNLLGGPPPTLLPTDPGAPELAAGLSADLVVQHFPTSSLAWAELADAAWAEGRIVDSYAYSRVGYHRGLDALRRNGWKGYGPVPWEHEPNRGFLRCLNGLSRTAAAIGEEDEATRCELFLRESSATAADALSGDNS